MPYTSNKKPSGLDSASSVAGTDVLVIEKSGSVQKATATQLVDHAFSTKGTAITNPSGSEVLVARDGSTLKDVALSNIVPALNITNAKVADAAAIAGTKISPNFGSQTVQTTGQVSAGSLAVSGNSTIGGTLVVTGALTANGGINATVTGTSSNANQLTTARNIAATGDIAWNVNFNGSADVTAAATIQNNQVTDAKLRSGTACSVIGRSANSTGDVADISAASDDLVLQRSSGSLGFGQVSTGGIADGAVSQAKLDADAVAEINIEDGAVTTFKILDQAVTPTKLSGTMGIHIITASFTLNALSFAGWIIQVNAASAATLTIPTDATLTYPIGTTIHILRWGAGEVTIAGASGVTLRSASSRFRIGERYATCSIIKMAANEWVVVGNLKT